MTRTSLGKKIRSATLSSVGGRCSTSLSMINSEYFGLLILISVQIIIYWLVRRENRNQQSTESTSSEWRRKNKFKLMLGYRIF